MNKISSELLILFLLLCSIISCKGIEVEPELLSTEVPELAVIPDQYIVILKNANPSARKAEGTYDEYQASLRKEYFPLLTKHQISQEDLLQIYAVAIPGFTAKLTKDQVASLKQDPQVLYVEEDKVVELRPLNDINTSEEVNTQVTPIGVTRVKGGAKYRGRNVVFVIDTGIDVDHEDLNVECVDGFSSFFQSVGGSKISKSDFTDGHGHGTHVAGTIAAKDNKFGVIGVAAGAKVVPVKVLDQYGRGSNSTVIAGIDFVGCRGKRGDVANMSIGGPPSEAVDQAVRNASEKGIWFIIASGNSAEHANTMSPQRINGKYILTIGSVNSADTFSWFSNYGRPPVDYVAPGERVLSTWKGGGYTFSSGTSMAAPHVAGLRLLGEIDSDGFALKSRDGDEYPIAVRKF